MFKREREFHIEYYFEIEGKWIYQSKRYSYEVALEVLRNMKLGMMRWRIVQVDRRVIATRNKYSKVILQEKENDNIQREV